MALLGSAHGGGIFIVFTEGIVMVGGALLLFAFNATFVADGLLRLAGGRSQSAPVARIALSYPSRRSSRTTVSLAIFALVVFVLVAIAATGATVDGSLGVTLQQQSGGYTFVSYSAVPISNLPELIANNSTVAPFFNSVVPLDYGGIYVNVSGFSGNPFSDSIYSAPPGAPLSSNFYSTNRFTFTATEAGASASQVNTELATDPDVAIVDQGYAPVTNNLGTGSRRPSEVIPGGTLQLTNPGERTSGDGYRDRNHDPIARHGGVREPTDRRRSWNLGREGFLLIALARGLRDLRRGPGGQGGVLPVWTRDPRHRGPPCHFDRLDRGSHRPPPDFCRTWARGRNRGDGDRGASGGR